MKPFTSTSEELQDKYNVKKKRKKEAARIMYKTRKGDITVEDQLTPPTVHNSIQGWGEGWGRRGQHNLFLSQVKSKYWKGKSSSMHCLNLEIIAFLSQFII